MLLKLDMSRMLLRVFTFHVTVFALADAAAVGRELSLRHGSRLQRVTAGLLDPSSTAVAPRNRTSAAPALSVDASAQVKALLAKPNTALAMCCDLGTDTGSDGKNFRNPTVWGPPTWFFLHSMTLALPDKVPVEQQEALKQVMYNLQKVLPCPGCGENLGKHMQKEPIEPHLSTREGMIRWMIDIHNMVNKDTGAPELSQEEALRQFTAAYKKDSDKKYLEVIGRSGAAPGSGQCFSLLFAMAAAVAVLIA